MFSNRTAFDRRKNTLAQRLSARDAQIGAFYDLTVSNPTVAGIDYDARAFARGYGDARALRYEPEAFGSLAARETVAGRIPQPPRLDRLMLTASTSEAYGLLFKLLCDPGDAVAVPAPSYPLFEHLATLENVELVPYRLAYDGAWHVDLPSLRRALDQRSRTKAIIVVSPNNPTGSFLKRDEHAALVAFGLPILADEVFADYGFAEDPRRVVTARERSDVLTFAMGGLSKACALPQAKLAWTTITGPEPDAREATERLEIVADAYLSVSTPTQVALPSLFELGDRARAQLRARTIENRAFLVDALTEARSPITLLHAEGGWTACLRLPATRSEEDWVCGLLDEADVLVQPGAFYEFAEEPMVIVSLITPPQVFAEGVRRAIAHSATRVR